MFNLRKKYLLIILFIFLNSFSFSETIHKVQKGDTLYSIGRKYQITVSELRVANNLSEKDVLKVGKKLIIPSADIENAVALSTNYSVKSNSKNTKSYAVQKGDTLYGIAKKYNIKVAELCSLNGLTSNDVLKVGQKIKVPDFSATENDIPDIQAFDPRKYSTVKLDSNIKWPVKKPKVTYVSGKVSGVRLTSATKEDVKNLQAGTVVHTGAYFGFGEVVFVQSKAGLVYVYTGLSSVKVKRGEHVVLDDVLGKAGVDYMTNSDGINFMVIKNGVYIDPAKAPRS